MPIETLINMEFCKELMSQGHSKTAAQKALLFTRNSTLTQKASASKWPKIGYKTTNTIRTSRKKQ